MNMKSYDGYDEYETCMAREVDGWNILWWLWGPQESKEEREEHFLLTLLS
jgi:hypothetical protein